MKRWRRAQAIVVAAALLAVAPAAHASHRRLTMKLVHKAVAAYEHAGERSGWSTSYRLRDCVFVTSRRAHCYVSERGIDITRDRSWNYGHHVVIRLHGRRVWIGDPWIVGDAMSVRASRR